MSGYPASVLARDPTLANQMFSVEQYGKFYFHIVDREESDVPIKAFVPFDLHTPINRIFRFKAWRNIPFDYNNNGNVDTAYMKSPRFDFPYACYERMEPALQLATYLIDRARPFFIHVYRGNVSKVGDKIVLDPDFVPTPVDEFAYGLAQEQLVEDTLWTYLPRRTTPQDTRGSVIHGTTGVFTDINGRAPRNMVAHIGLSHEIIYSLGLSDFYTKPEHEREAMLVNMATLLFHEYAHALWYTRNYEDRFDTINNAAAMWRPEPLVPPARWNELGYIANIIVFGFTLNFAWPADKKEPLRSGQGGLRATYLDADDYLHAIHLRRISRETLHSFFNQLTWAPRADGRPSIIDIHLLDITENEFSDHPTQAHTDPSPAPSPPPTLIQPVPTPADDQQDGSAAHPFIID